MNSKPHSPNTHAASTNTPPWLGLSVLLLAGFVTIFDLFVVNVAIPNIQSQLGASFSQIGFIVAGYELAFGVLLITGGRLGDLFGRRKLFIIGMAGFTLTSALCGLAPNAFFLIIARVLQGLAAALLFPQVYASIRVNFDGDNSRRAFGLLGMTLGLAAIAGQVLGGWLIHADLFDLGWRNIFLINIPIGLLAIAAARYIPETCMVKLSGWRDILNDRPMPDRHRENSPAPPITVDKELSGAVHRTATADLNASQRAGWRTPRRYSLCALEVLPCKRLCFISVLMLPRLSWSSA